MQFFDFLGQFTFIESHTIFWKVLIILDNTQNMLILS